MYTFPPQIIPYHVSWSVEEFYQVTAETIVYVKESAQNILKGINLRKSWCVVVLSAMGTIISLKRVSAVLTDATCRILFYFMFPSYLFLMEQFVEGYYFWGKAGRIKELFRKMFVWFVRGEFMN